MNTEICQNGSYLHSNKSSLGEKSNNGRGSLHYNPPHTIAINVPYIHTRQLNYEKLQPYPILSSPTLIIARTLLRMKYHTLSISIIYYVLT